MKPQSSLRNFSLLVREIVVHNTLTRTSRNQRGKNLGNIINKLCKAIRSGSKVQNSGFRVEMFIDKENLIHRFVSFKWRLFIDSTINWQSMNKLNKKNNPER